MTSSDFTLPVIDPDHCRRMLDPWLARSMPISSAEWKAILKKDANHWRRKIVKRTIRSKLSAGVKPLTAFRTREHVGKTYTDTWANIVWPTPHKPETMEEATFVEWQDEGLVLGMGGHNQMGLERMMAIIEAVQPRKVLEVGAGYGVNLLTMAAAFPDIEFTGLELTEAGVMRAKSVQDAALIEPLVKYCPYPVKDRDAHRRVEFLQGDATRQPFEDNSFDLVFSRLALEQMELVRDEAVREIVRVSKQYMLCVEPFDDYNRSEHKKRAQKAKNFLTLSIADLPSFGLSVIHEYSAWPQKISEGTGLMLAELK